MSSARVPPKKAPDADGGSKHVRRINHYRELAAEFRRWAEAETVPEARGGLLDMATQYERLASELEASTRRLRC